MGNEFSKRVKICSFFSETLTQTASHKWINNKTQIKHFFRYSGFKNVLKICLVCLSPLIKKLDIQLTWYVIAHQVTLAIQSRSLISMKNSNFLVFFPNFQKPQKVFYIQFWVLNNIWSLRSYYLTVGWSEEFQAGKFHEPV